MDHSKGIQLSKLHSVAMSITKRRGPDGTSIEDREDLAQDAVVEIIQRGRQCSMETLVKSRTVDLWRRKSNEHRALGGFAARRAFASTAGETKMSHDLDLKIDIETILRTCRAKDRELVELMLSGRSKAEISRITGLDKATVTKRFKSLRAPFRPLAFPEKSGQVLEEDREEVNRDSSESRA